MSVGYLVTHSGQSVLDSALHFKPDVKINNYNIQKKSDEKDNCPEDYLY